MSLNSYQAACSNLLEELAASLSAAEVEALRTWCANNGEKAFYQWCDGCLPEVRAYVSAAPSRRRAVKKWQAPETRAILVLAAHVPVQQAGVFLQAVEQNRIEPGHSYRDMADHAGAAFLDVLLADIDLWPFGPNSPFDP